MRRVIHDFARGRLVYLDAQATPEFWDAHWQAEGEPVASREDTAMARLTARHLPRRARVLEAGCGRGNKVKALHDAGFEAVGIDFAPDSVRRARRGYPGLDIREGDVRALPFPDGHFDGYWSIGVIEHFWEGYDEILAEARRVLRPGGFAFLSAPWFSPYRRRRAARGGYPAEDFRGEPTDFYQFALRREEVAASFDRHGFDVARWKGLAPEVCMLEDMASVERPVAWLFGSRGGLPKQVLRRAVQRAFAPWCGHSFLVVARRRSDATPR